MTPTNVLAPLAVLLTALAFVPSAAHLFSLPNKIGMAEAAYFAAQRAYDGWALFGIVWVAALVANAALAFALRRRSGPGRLALLATLCMAASFAIFFVWTLPANQATASWTVAPADWQSLRAQWEYSHAVNAAVIFGALVAVTLAALRAKDLRQ